MPAKVHDESKLQKFWFLSKPLAADKVVVDEKDTISPGGLASAIARTIFCREK